MRFFQLRKQKHGDINAQSSVKAHLETLVRQIMIKNCRCNVTFVIFENFDILSK